MTNRFLLINSAPLGGVSDLFAYFGICICSFIHFLLSIVRFFVLFIFSESEAVHNYLDDSILGEA